MKPGTMPDNINKKVLSTKKPSVEREANLLLQQLLTIYDEKYFYGKISGNATVCWSKRMTLCAGCTQEPTKEKLCSISLSRPLLELRPIQDLVETLLHEMIHAFLWVTGNVEEQEHGPKYCAEMRRIEKVSGIKLGIFHEFLQECIYLQTHVWKCNGPCRKTNYENSIVRRTLNRPPSNKEKWFRTHASMCGGTFVKIKEPSGEKTEFKPRIEKEIRALISKMMETPKEAENRSASFSEKDSPNDNYNLDGTTLTCPSFDSLSDFDSSDFSTDEEPAKTSTRATSLIPPPKEDKTTKITTRVESVTPPKANPSKAASTQHVLLTPPPTENKHPKMIEFQSPASPTKGKPTKITTGAASVTPLKENLFDTASTRGTLLRSTPTENKPAKFTALDESTSQTKNTATKITSRAASVTPLKENLFNTASTRGTLLRSTRTEKAAKFTTLDESSSLTKNTVNTASTRGTLLRSTRTEKTAKFPTLAESTTSQTKNTVSKTTAVGRTKSVPPPTKNKTKKILETSENLAAKEKATKTEAPTKVSSVKKSADSSSKIAKLKKKELKKGKTELALKDNEKTMKYKWQCYGPCQNKAPMFGRVERLINRPPNRTEKWFLLHEKDCGGSFVRLD